LATNKKFLRKTLNPKKENERNPNCGKEREKAASAQGIAEEICVVVVVVVVVGIMIVA
jgi:hypothetical protein